MTRSDASGSDVRMVPITAEVVSQPAPQVVLPQELASFQGEAYRIQPGDTLIVTVWDHPELTTPAGNQQQAVTNGRLVQPDGTFYFPYAGKMNTQENGDLGYSVNPITNSIRDAFGPTCGSVTGTDLNPLVVELVMNGQSNRARYDNSVFTIGAGSATAPTDWAWSPFCGCPSTDPRYPIICQQETPAAACPPIADASARPVLAVGFLLWGIRGRRRDWRIASLVLMLAAVAKVFLFDASGLEGLLRIASFVALGFSLIGIGWLYSRQLRREGD